MGNPYLLLYNAAACAGWAYVLYLTISVSFIQQGSSEDVYRVAQWPLKLVQSAALLEVLHSAVGLVRSPVAITAMQVASRLWVVWGIIVPVPGPTTSKSIALFKAGDTQVQLNLVSLLVAWSIAEIIRYGFFAVKELLGSVPYPVLWARYTGFIILYPLGVASELTVAYLALPTIKSTGLFSLRLPNVLNFGFDYYTVCIVVMLSYLPGLPMLYSYMLSQRSKQLGGKGKKEKGA